MLGVTFRWKDYAHDGKRRKMTLMGTEFLRRFFLHWLNCSQMKRTIEVQQLNTPVQATFLPNFHILITDLAGAHVEGTERAGTQCCVALALAPDSHCGEGALVGESGNYLHTGG
jgi:hypothetical protein